MRQLTIIYLMLLLVSCTPQSIQQPVASSTAVMPNLSPRLIAASATSETKTETFFEQRTAVVKFEQTQTARDTKWLRDDPCAAPCWEGIIPGKTTVGEALILLKQVPEINPKSVSVVRDICRNEVPGSRVIQWGWVGSSSWQMVPNGTIRYLPLPQQGIPPNTCGDVISRFDVTPDAAALALPIISIEPKFSRKLFFYEDFRRRYGDPSHVAAFDLVIGPQMDTGTEKVRFVSLVYKQQGLVLRWFGRRNDIFNPARPFESVIFTSEPEQEAAVELPYLDAVVRWDGPEHIQIRCYTKQTHWPCQ